MATTPNPTEQIPQITPIPTNPYLAKIGLKPFTPYNPNSETGQQVEEYKTAEARRLEESAAAAKAQNKIQEGQDVTTQRREGAFSEGQFNLAAGMAPGINYQNTVVMKQLKDQHGDLVDAIHTRYALMNADIDQKTRDTLLKSVDDYIENQRKSYETNLNAIETSYNVNKPYAGTGAGASVVKLAPGLQGDVNEAKGLLAQISSLNSLKGPNGEYIGAGPGSTVFNKPFSSISTRPGAIDTRAAIGQIKATIAKLRGGTSFTAGEEKMLNQYTPNVDDTDKQIEIKLGQLETFYKQKILDTYGTAAYNQGIETPDIDTLLGTPAAGSGNQPATGTTSTGLSYTVTP